MNTIGFTKDSYDDDYKYLNGWGNHHSSEKIKGALPVGQNSPQQCPFGLYAEQINGTAFTAPRAQNQRSWLYRIRPAAGHDPFVPYGKNPNLKAEFSANPTPAPFRWMPQPIPGNDQKVDFVDGMFTVCGSGNAQAKAGFAIHMYTANTNMVNRAFCNADGDFLIAPQQGPLTITTEFGKMLVTPTEICIIPRGIRFSVSLKSGPVRGYIAEVFSSHFMVPDLGPIGSNMLANPRDFLYPTADYEDVDVDFEIIQKFQGHLFSAKQGHSCFDVVAWHGNYAPFKYNTKYFAAVNSVTFDHPDPSIYTILTCPSSEHGTAIMDFAIFPPRWTVANHTFRPPWFHRNTASEFMGLVHGKYEAREKGFIPGGASLHNTMTAHGPEVDVFERASHIELKPERIADDALALMFESSLMMNPTEFALKKMTIDDDYVNSSWKGFKKHFKPPQ